MQETTHEPTYQACPRKDENWALEDGSWALNMGLDGRNIRNGSNERVVKRVTELIISETDLKQRQDKGSLVRIEDDGEEQSFWQGFESELGQLKEWMGRRERKPNK
ncbi:hypothetical protein SLA2020_219620 [Shorea laevis]